MPIEQVSIQIQDALGRFHTFEQSIEIAEPDLRALLDANGFTPELAADFQQESGSELLRAKGQNRLFEAMFPSFSRAGLATMVDSDGLLKWAPHNLLTYSEDFSQFTNKNNIVVSDGFGDPEDGTNADKLTDSGVGGTGSVNMSENFNLPSAGRYTFGVFLKADQTSWVRLTATGYDSTTNVDVNLSTGELGSGNEESHGSIADVGGGWYLVNFYFDTSADLGGFLVITLSDGEGVLTLDLDSSNSIFAWGAHVYRSDLGGMVNNPDHGDSYVPTTTAARYLPRRNHHVWDGSAWVNKGLRYETEARTNLLLNSGTLSTQNVTVTNAAHTIHFTGTGTITLSGASTAGPLVGTGTGEGNRVSLTFTPTAGTLTVTVSGTVTNAQLEVGATPSSYIPTAGATATRAAESGLTIPSALMPWNAGGVSGALVGLETYADIGAVAQVTLMDWRLDVNNRITLTLDTDGVKTGTLTLTMVNAGVSASTAATVELTPGVNTPYSVAWRATGSEINIALNGTAETALATAIGLPDLSGSDMALDGMGAKSQVLGWPEDIADAGIMEASA